jgi:hypothetical protein
MKYSRERKEAVLEKMLPSHDKSAPEISTDCSASMKPGIISLENPPNRRIHSAFAYVLEYMRGVTRIYADGGRGCNADLRGLGTRM